MQRALVSLLSLMLMFVLSLSAGAAVAPQYVSSEPSDGEALHEAPARVSITFSEPLDDSSAIAVYDECNRRVDNENTQISTTRTEMSVGIVLTPSGKYVVRYTATGVGGVTGTAQGSFSFTVHAGESCDDSGGGHHGGDGDGHDGGHDGGGHAGGHDGDHDHDGDHGEGGHADRGEGGHEDMAAGDHGEHGTGAPDGKHGGHGGRHGEHETKAPDPEKERSFALGETRFPQLEPESWAVLVALVASVGLGIFGGWILRYSARS